MKTLRIAGLLVFGFALHSFAADEAKRAPKNIPDFDVQGIIMTECKCTAYACPCRSNGHPNPNGHPNHGSCDAADFTYIKHGHYGKVDMSGFKAVVVGDLIDADASKVQGTAYFDKRSTPAQREAFNEMLAFMFGWNPPRIVGTKIVSIDLKESSDKNTYILTVPDILEEKGVMKRDSDGKTLHLVPAMDLWGNKITYLDNIVFKDHDKSLRLAFLSFSTLAKILASATDSEDRSPRALSRESLPSSESTSRMRGRGTRHGSDR